MSQRYVPSSFGAPILIASGDPGLYPATAIPAAEFNTLIVGVLFGNVGGTCQIVPWVSVKSKTTPNGPWVENWFRLDTVTISAEADTPNAPPATLSGTYRGRLQEIAIPNCHSVKIELLGDSAPTTIAPTTPPPTSPADQLAHGEMTIWAVLANRAPR